MEFPPLREYQKRISEAAGSFGKLKRNTFFLMTGSRVDSDPLAGIVMYLNSCFHIDLLQFFTVVKEMKSHLKEFEVLVEEMGKRVITMDRGIITDDTGSYITPERQRFYYEN